MKNYKNIKTLKDVCEITGIDYKKACKMEAYDKLRIIEQAMLKDVGFMEHKYYPEYNGERLLFSTESQAIYAAKVFEQIMKEGRKYNKIQILWWKFTSWIKGLFSTKYKYYKGF